MLSYLILLVCKLMITIVSVYPPPPLFYLNVKLKQPLKKYPDYVSISKMVVAFCGYSEITVWSLHIIMLYIFVHLNNFVFCGCTF